ncbi:MAG: NAD-dependent epimerase/dehydratase family protein [bacterium]
MAKTIFEKKNILVAGGAGFIGSHLCDELVRNNKVICVDNFLTGLERNIDHLLRHPDFVFIKHDIVEPLDLDRVPELAKFKTEFQGVQEIYFAASPDSPKEYLKHPVETLLINSLGLKNMLDLAVKYKAKFMYLSSSAIYGQAPAIPAGKKFFFKENYQGSVNTLEPHSSYIEGKRFGETLSANYRDKYELDVKIVRLFDIYGPRMKFLDGRIIPEMVSLALDNKEVVVEGDGNSLGSFCYVSDLVKGLQKVMDSQEAGPINLGSNWDLKLADLARQIVELTGSSSKIKLADPKIVSAVLPPKLPDIDLVKDRLGWFPVVLLVDGLKKIIDDLRASKGLINL